MLSNLMQRLNERRAAEFEAEGSADAGFTLIELMVVLLILAILLAIAIPTFLGVTGNANERAAQSNLNTSLTTAKAAETQNSQTYGVVGPPDTRITITSLHANEPSITFVAGAVTVQGQVSVWVDAAAGNGIVLATYSKSTNHCWYAVDNIGFVTGGTANGIYTDVVAAPGITGSATSAPTAAGTFYGKSGTSGTTSCDASNVVALGGATWGTKYPT